MFEPSWTMTRLARPRNQRWPSSSRAEAWWPGARRPTEPIFGDSGGLTVGMPISVIPQSSSITLPARSANSDSSAPETLSPPEKHALTEAKSARRAP